MHPTALSATRQDLAAQSTVDASEKSQGPVEAPLAGMAGNLKGFPQSPLRAIKQFCQKCSGGFKGAAWCTSTGLDGTLCPLWPFRFGYRPATAAAKFGSHVVDPGAMPTNEVSLDNLPANPRKWKHAKRCQ